MAKRFTETGKWDKAWFRKLPSKLKVAWVYLCDKCDQAGVWPVDMDMMNFALGEEILLKELIDNFDVELLPKDRLWIKNFIHFQYGDDLSEKCAPHRSIISLVKKHGLQVKINGIMPPIIALKRTPIPRKIKDKILKDSNYTCGYCGNGSGGPYPMEVDHIVSIDSGGRHHEDNLVACCNFCNRNKGKKDVFEFIKSKDPEKMSNSLKQKLGYLKGTGYPSQRVKEKEKDKDQEKEEEKEKEKEKEKETAQHVIRAFVDAHRIRYGKETTPHIGPKEAGMAKNLLVTYDVRQLSLMFQVYVQMEDRFFLAKAHDLPTFCSNLNAVKLALQKGRKNPNEKGWHEYVDELERKNEQRALPETAG